MKSHVNDAGEEEGHGFLNERLGTQAERDSVQAGSRGWVSKEDQ